jgi:polyisoprenyl-phosphate glycosyltransferase
MTESNLTNRYRRANLPLSLSVVIPCYNEEEVLPILFTRLGSVLDSIKIPSEIILINDGSRDRTLEILLNEQLHNNRIRIISLSRNFGHQAALTAGLEHASGQVILIIDADLQDPPELLPKMLDKWQEGYDVIYGQRSHRLGEPFLKKLFAFVFYRVFERIVKVPVPKDTGDFRLMDRSALDALKSLNEQHRFIRGMVSWIGFRQTAIKYERPERVAGTTKYPFRKSLFLAFDAITSFSYAPLRLATYIGVLVSAFAFFYIIVVVILKVLLIFTGLKIAETPGYTSIMAFLLLLGGMQLIFLGLIGEYVGRIFEQGKGRPLFLISEKVGFTEDK